MKNKKCIILIFIFIIILSCSNITFGYVQLIELNTIDIQNISGQSNLYILLKNKDYSEKTGIYKEGDDNINNLIKKIDKNAINIEREYGNNKLPKQLENTNEFVTIDENEYTKIKVLNDITIAWTSENILIARMFNNQTDLIDINNITVANYHDGSVENYGGNSVKRKAIVYDANENKIKDITQSKVKEEEGKLNSIEEENKQKKEFLDKVRPIAFVIIAFIIIPIIAGLITEVIARKIKEKNK